jgi:hypothetical protein
MSLGSRFAATAQQTQQTQQTQLETLHNIGRYVIPYFTRAEKARLASGA